LVAASGVLAGMAAGVHLFRTALDKEPARSDNIGYFPARRVRIVTDEPRKVVVDGEMIGTTPVDIVCQPRSLRLLVPEPARREPTSLEADVSGLDAEIEPR
jgi:diacylglycerol kinase family enzyme